MMPFAHLHVHSAFSFLDGVSSVKSLVLRAAEMGQPALALTDTNSVTGIPSFVAACDKANIKPIGGSAVQVEGGGHLVLLADGPTGWASLCCILTAAGMRDVKRQGIAVTWEDLEAFSEGLVCLSGSFGRGRLPALLRARRYQEAEDFARRCQSVFGKGNYFLQITRTLTEGEGRISREILELADHLGAPAIAANPIHHATKAGLAAYEALCRVRLGLAPEDEHADLPLNGEGYLKSETQMRSLYADCPQVLGRASELAERLQPPLEAGVRHYPRYGGLPPNQSAFSFLAEIVWCGAERRYKTLTDIVKARLIHELETIRDLDFCHYFLVCWDIAGEARKRGVRYALRGSGVGSAVAHCLFLSEHDPIARNISFERFLSKGRAKPPDLDIDFQHDERDAMMDYLRGAYGHDRVANVSNYVTFRARSLLRDLGKVMGYDTGEMDRLRELLGYSRGDDLAAEIERTPELRALGIDAAQYADLFALCAQLSGLPRHLGTHSSGIVASDVPLAMVAPTPWAAKGVPVVALDKDDVEEVGLLKIDELGLRALTAIEIAVGTRQQADPAFDYDGRDREDPETLSMIRAAQTVGCFQLESPAQMGLQWRLRADKFDDLVASVALIRPGPIMGGSVDAYIARRHGRANVTYPLPELEPVLCETYGRILHQDPVLDVVRIVHDLSATEADKFQNAITHARCQLEKACPVLDLYGPSDQEGVLKALEADRGLFPLRLCPWICSSLWRPCAGHGLAAKASSGRLPRGSLLHRTTRILARDNGGRGSRATWRDLLGPCINRSHSQCWVLEDVSVEHGTVGHGIRCSLSYVQTLGKAAVAVEEERRTRGLFASLEDICLRCHFLTREQLEWMILAGAMDDLTENSRQALWSLTSLHRERTKGRQRIDARTADGQAALDVPIPFALASGMPDFTAEDRYVHEWSALGFSPQGHPLRFMRDGLKSQGIFACADLQSARAGEKVRIAGLIVRPHRPPTAGGVVFFSLEDETGLAHVAVMPDVYQKVGPVVYDGGIVTVTGRAERRGEGISVLVTAMTAVA